MRKRAEKNAVSAKDWYEAQSETLGIDFITSIETTIQLIADNPFLFQIRYKNIRCALTHRFPYGIYYLIKDSNTVIVLAILHHSQNKVI